MAERATLPDTHCIERESESVVVRRRPPSVATRGVYCFVSLSFPGGRPQNDSTTTSYTLFLH